MTIRVFSTEPGAADGVNVADIAYRILPGPCYRILDEHSPRTDRMGTKEVSFLPGRSEAEASVLAELVCTTIRNMMPDRSLVDVTYGVSELRDTEVAADAASRSLAQAWAKAVIVRNDPFYTMSAQQMRAAYPPEQWRK